MARLLYCRCAYAQVVPKDVKDRVLETLAASGTSFEAVSDLCEMSARRDPRLAELAAAGDLKIAACYPRAVKWLFAGAGSPLPGTGVEVRNMRVETADEVTAALLAPAPEGAR